MMKEPFSNLAGRGEKDVAGWIHDEITSILESGRDHARMMNHSATNLVVVLVLKILTALTVNGFIMDYLLVS